MIVAIPVFNGRVAPVFDWAGRLLLAEIGGEDHKEPEERGIAEVVPLARPAYLRRAGVEVLICGGISTALGALITTEGIEVVPGIVGDASEVLTAYRTGGLSGPRWSMPGWCGRPGGRSGRGRAGGFCGRRGGRRRGRGWGEGPEGGDT